MGRSLETRTPEIKIFSTSPQSSAVDQESYVQNVIDVARWSEEAGCEGILVYTDNALVDPWQVSQIIIQNTTLLCPLVAVQPAYMHPYSVAKMVTSLGHLYRRSVYLNMVAGGFKHDLEALHDTTPHDKRYARLVEYTTIVKELLLGVSPVTFHGDFYVVDKLRLTPPLPPELFPGIFVSGSSVAGLESAQALGATAIKYPQPVECEPDRSDGILSTGVRVGIIARRHGSDAWSVAHARFPEDRKGQLTHQLAMKTSDSMWHQQLSRLSSDAKSDQNPYWLVPFENYKTFCPYLVGRYDCVAAELAEFIGRGYGTFILDIPPSKEELGHINTVFTVARQLVAR
jgi:alkanesulfonate monooxygenase